jgi:hypothetical protein
MGSQIATNCLLSGESGGNCVPFLLLLTRSSSFLLVRAYLDLGGVCSASIADRVTTNRVPSILFFVLLVCLLDRGPPQDRMDELVRERGEFIGLCLLVCRLVAN